MGVLGLLGFVVLEKRKDNQSTFGKLIDNYGVCKNRSWKDIFKKTKKLKIILIWYQKYKFYE